VSRRERNLLRRTAAPPRPEWVSSVSPMRCLLVIARCWLPHILETRREKCNSKSRNTGHSSAYISPRCLILHGSVVPHASPTSCNFVSCLIRAFFHRKGQRFRRRDLVKLGERPLANSDQVLNPDHSANFTSNQKNLQSICRAYPGSILLDWRILNRQIRWSPRADGQTQIDQGPFSTQRE
jgi:hypothetical protein